MSANQQTPAATARVISGHGRTCLIETEAGQRLRAHTRGKRSEVVVGDRVRWSPSGDEAVIDAIEPRRNLLHRQDAWRSKSFAANLDQILVWIAVEPVFSESQLARALIAAEAAGIPTRVVLNKVDLPGADAARQRLAPYRSMGLEVLELSLKHDIERARQMLEPVLDDRVSLVLGPSGAGKSTLINRFVPDADAQVGEISTALNSGRHTTTATRWYALDAEHRSVLIDTPGFQSFGLAHVAPEALCSLMPDLASTATDCRFHNCSHRVEPGCSVLAAVEAGRLAPSRWRLYVELRDELDQIATLR